ncbi:MAG: hypothetical protein Q4D65_05350 [Peptostreptococcaceae bacterium]|nr:hypothetical protein [Peptostreptococcaceae bacterium]
MNNTKKILLDIESYPALEIIDAQKIYKNKFQDISESAFHKAMSRMTKEGLLHRMGKGIYCRASYGKFGKRIAGEKDIISYYIGKNRNQGVIFGYRMYNRYGITTQVSKTVEIYSKNTLKDKRKLNNVTIHKLDLRFDIQTIRIIELMDVIQNCREIEELNRENFLLFVKNSIEFYDEKVLKKLMNKIKYKKSTLASLKNILDYYQIENTVGQYLSKTSRYSSICMEELYEKAS